MYAHYATLVAREREGGFRSPVSGGKCKWDSEMGGETWGVEVGSQTGRQRTKHLHVGFNFQAIVRTCVHNTTVSVAAEPTFYTQLL